MYLVTGYKTAPSALTCRLRSVHYGVPQGGMRAACIRCSHPVPLVRQTSYVSTQYRSRHSDGGARCRFIAHSQSEGSGQSAEWEDAESLQPQGTSDPSTTDRLELSDTAECSKPNTLGPTASPQPEVSTSPAETDTTAATSTDDFDRSLSEQLRAATRKLQAVEEYAEHLQQDEDDIDLFHCAVLIARHAYPFLDEGQCLAELDGYAAAIKSSLPENAYPLRVIKAISQHLASVAGFRGNSTDYYHPDNSCINQVLANRTGLPITLSLVYMEVARRLGVPLVGINLPGHFMLAPRDESLELLVDAFNGGEVCFREDAEERLTSVLGMHVKIDPRLVQEKIAISKRGFLGRILNNLKQIYIGMKAPATALEIIRYIRATRPADVEEIRDEGLCYFALQRYSDCAAAMREYLAAAPDATDAAQVEDLLRRMSSSSQAPEAEQA